MTAAIRARLMQPWRHGEAADLRSQSVMETLDLRGLALSGVDFSGTTFHAPVLAMGARFEGLSWFSDAQFLVGADFSGALFTNDARFDGAEFVGEAGFEGAEFRGIARFDGACTKAAMRFGGAMCYGNAAFGAARLTGPADFSGAEFLGGFWGNNLHLDGPADFSGTEVHGRLWLKGARLGNSPLRADAFGLAFGYVYS